MLFNVYWLVSLYLEYFRVIPDNEHGFVIVGMIFIMPIFMLVIGFIIMALAYLGRFTFNKVFKRDAASGAP